MSKKNVTLKVEANTKEAVKELNKVNENLKKLQKETPLDKLSKLGSVVSGVKAGFDMLTDAIGGVVDGIMDCTNLYNIQADAEARLEVASRNNPYLNAESVNSLKNYASELQSIGEIGDETLLPMMAELAASGRTQEQIQSIMKAALNASATGMISMESAVQALNGSLNGSVGSIGKLLPNLKNLSKEELESGKAIEEVQKAFDGMSEATANPVVQFQNAWGDLKENIGSIFAPIISTVAGFFTKVVNGVSEVKKVIDKFKASFSSDEDSLVVDSNSEVGVTKEQIENAEKNLFNLKKNISSTQKIIDSLSESVEKESEELKRAGEADMEATLAEIKRMKESGNVAEREYAEGIEEIKEYSKKLAEYERNLARLKQKIDEFRISHPILTSDDEKHLKNLNEQVKLNEKASDRVKKDIKDTENAISIYEHLFKMRDKIFGAEVAASASRGGASAQLKYNQDLLATYTAQAEESERTVQAMKDRFAEQERIAAEEASAAGRNARQAENDKKVSDALGKYNEAVRTKQSELQARKDLGEEISQSAEAQELLNTKTSAYITFWQEVGTLGTTQAAKIRADIEKTAELIEDAPEKVKTKYEQWTEEISREMGRIDVELDFDLENGIDTTQLQESMQNLQDLLKERLAEIKGELSEMEVAGINTDEQKAKYDELLKLYDDYAKKREAIDKEIETLNKDSGEKQIEQIQKVIDKTMECLSSLSNSLKSFSDLFTEMYENQAKTQIAELDKTYSEGEMSLEDYNKQKEKIEKESAQKAYKIQMWAWSAQVVQAMASVAQGMVQALADPQAITPALKIANMAMVGTAGAANIATVIKNKPIPPSFATGGIVGGSSYHGDKVQANVNSGEMILNAQQQRALWETANGKGAMGGPQLKVTVKNFMGDSAQVNQSINNDELVMTVTRIVNKGLQDGSLRDGLTAGMNGLDGDVYVS